MLQSLKIDLGIMTDAYNARLQQYLDAAMSMIEQEGATLNTSDPQDAQLVVMYAAWLWRRRDTGEGMPRMVRYALNCRIIAEKINA